MKRIIALGLAMLLLLGGAALAEEMIAFESYAANLSALSDESWQEDGSAEIQVLNLDEQTTLSVATRSGNVLAVTVETVHEGDLYDTALAALDALGCLSAQTLEALPDLTEAEPLVADGYVLGKLSGETREGIYICAEAEMDAMVWQPVHGGSRYHDSASCSGMDVARLVTREAAEQAGFEPCGKCKP